MPILNERIKLTTKSEIIQNIQGFWDTPPKQTTEWESEFGKIKKAIVQNDNTLACKLYLDTLPRIEFEKQDIIDFKSQIALVIKKLKTL